MILEKKEISKTVGKRGIKVRYIEPRSFFFLNSYISHRSPIHKALDKGHYSLSSTSLPRKKQILQRMENFSDSSSAGVKNATNRRNRKCQLCRILHFFLTIFLLSFHPPNHAFNGLWKRRRSAESPSGARVCDRGRAPCLRSPAARPAMATCLRHHHRRRPPSSSEGETRADDDADVARWAAEFDGAVTCPNCEGCVANGDAAVADAGERADRSSWWAVGKSGSSKSPYPSAARRAYGLPRRGCRRRYRAPLRRRESTRDEAVGSGPDDTRHYSPRRRFPARPVRRWR